MIVTDCLRVSSPTEMAATCCESLPTFNIPMMTTTTRTKPTAFVHPFSRSAAVGDRPIRDHGAVAVAAAAAIVVGADQPAHRRDASSSTRHASMIVDNVVSFLLPPPPSFVRRRKSTMSTVAVAAATMRRSTGDADRPVQAVTGTRRRRHDDEDGIVARFSTSTTTTSSLAPSDDGLPTTSEEIRVSSADAAVPIDVDARLVDCPFYYARMTHAEAKSRLRGAVVGTFLLRDSADPRYQYSLSVRTARGTTSIRIVSGADSGSIGVDASSSPLRVANFRLDSGAAADEADHAALGGGGGGGGSGGGRMPSFDSVLRLCRHYVEVGRRVMESGVAGGGSGACMFLEKSGRMDMPVLLTKPFVKDATPPAAAVEREWSGDGLGRVKTSGIRAFERRTHADV